MWGGLEVEVEGGEVSDRSRQKKRYAEESREGFGVKMLDASLALRT